jgi:hypothetical protein
MAGNGNRSRPVRTLEVENFSVIKKAKLEFGRITLLIGPQASGKSLLCKLAYFLGGEVVEIAVESLMNRNSWEEFLKTAGREFNSRFSTAGWLKKNCKVSFSSQQYSAMLRGVGNPVNPELEFVFSEEFEGLYVAISRNPAKQPSFATKTPSERQALRQDLWAELSLLLNKRRTQTNIYIPSGRAFFTDLARAISTLEKPDLDPITRRFGGQITWDSRWKVGLLTTGRDVVPEIEKEMQRITGGVVAVVNDRPVFLSFDGRSLPLSQVSSGTLELLPMFNVLSRQAFELEHIYVYARAASKNVSPLADVSEHSPLIYLEEPEAHVFPDTQKKLIDLFAWMANDPILSFDWVITTHSPYILTAFNTLIEAWRAAKKTGRRDKVAAIVPEHSWISEDDFAAYTIQNRMATSIFRKEAEGVEGSGLIDGDYLDSVSDTISNQFSRLLEIEFAEAT